MTDFTLDDSLVIEARIKTSSNESPKVFASKLNVSPENKGDENTLHSSNRLSGEIDIIKKAINDYLTEVIEREDQASVDTKDVKAATSMSTPKKRKKSESD